MRSVSSLKVSEPRIKKIEVRCFKRAAPISMSLTIPVTRLIRAWTQRHWIEQMFRFLKHLLATAACQARSEDAYYGHFVLRLIAGFALFYTSRFIFKGHVTMEEIVFTLKHYWMTVDYEPFELYAIV